MFLGGIKGNLGYFWFCEDGLGSCCFNVVEEEIYISSVRVWMYTFLRRNIWFCPVRDLWRLRVV